MSIKTGITGTTESLFTIGDSTSGDGYKYIYADNGDGNLPGIRFNDDANQWEIANDGTTWLAIGAATVANGTDVWDILQWDGNSWEPQQDLTMPEGADRTITIQTASAGAGDQFNIYGATGASGSGGGVLQIQAGTGVGAATATGGRLDIFGGQGSAASEGVYNAANGGEIQLYGGPGGAGTASNPSGYGGYVHVRGGAAGAATATGNNGGYVLIEGGPATGDGNGGYVAIQSGVKSGSGSDNQIYLRPNEGSVILGTSGVSNAYLLFEAAAETPTQGGGPGFKYTAGNSYMETWNPDTSAWERIASNLPASTDQYTYLQGGTSGEWVEASDITLPYGANRTITVENGADGYDLTISGVTATGANPGGDIYITGGDSTTGSQGGSLYLDGGSPDDGNFGSIFVSTQTASGTQAVQLGSSGNNSTAELDFTSSGQGKIASDLPFKSGADREIYVETPTGETPGYDLTVSAGDGGTGSIGGNLFIQAGAGNTNDDGDIYIGVASTRNIALLASPGGGWNSGEGIVFLEETTTLPSAGPTTGGYFYGKDDGYLYWRSDMGEYNLVTGSGVPTSDHNNLNGLQGGTTNEYYHLTSAQHSTLTTGTQGDILWYNGGSWESLNIGADGYILKVNGSNLEWGQDLPINTQHNNLAGLQGGNGSDEYYHLDQSHHTLYTTATQGDLFYASGADTWAKLALGDDGDTLVTNGATVIWQENFYHAIYAGKQGSLLTNTDGYLLPNFSLATDTNVAAFVPSINSFAAKLYVNLGTAPGVGETVSVTVLDGLVPTNIAVDVSDENTSEEDTTDTHEFSKGDAINIRVTTTSGSAAADISVTLLVYPKYLVA